jgi:membrane protein DedA with SNARE-associated domain
MEHLEELIRRYGLLAVFIGGATEGDLTLVLAGALAHLHYFNFVLAAAVGSLGAVCIDSICYTLGRTRAGVIRSSRLYKQAGPTVEALAARIGPWEILIARFILGARIPSMVFWGACEIPIVRFVALDAAGCALWGGGLAALGYAFSSSLSWLLEDLERTERHLLIIVAAVAVVLLLHPIVRRLLRR